MDDLYSSIGLDSGDETVLGIDKIGKIKLWDPKWFLILSAIFSFLPAAILYSLNYGRIGNVKKKNAFLIISIVSFVVMILLAILINQSYVKIAFYALNFGVGFYLKQDQTALFNNHILNSGKKASFIIPIIMFIVCLYTSIILVSHIIAINGPEQKLLFRGSELYYTDNVQKSEAENLGDYLVKQNILSEDHKASCKIDKQSNIYKFSLIVHKEFLEDPEFEQDLKNMCSDLSCNVFNNFDVDIVLCDNTFKPLKTITNRTE